MNNKRGFTMIELVAGMVVMALSLAMLAYANQMLMQNKRSVDDMYENTTTFDYITLALLQDVKSSTGTFQVEPNVLRLYKPDGTYNEFRFDLGMLYRNSEKICDATTCDFKDLGNAVEVTMTFESMPDFNLTLYKPQQGYDG